MKVPSVLTALVAAATLSAAASASLAQSGLALPQPGETAAFVVSVSLNTRSGSEGNATNGQAEARLFSLANDAGGSRFVVIFRPEHGGGNAPVKDSMAFLVVDPKGRLLPDVGHAGMKVTLDPIGWTAAGLIPRVPAERLASPGTWEEEVDVQVFGELFRLPLTHTVSKTATGYSLDRRAARGNIPLKAGRQTPPTVREYTDRWNLDTAGRPVDWSHRTRLDVVAAGQPEVSITIDLSARRATTGRIDAGELAGMNADAEKLKPIWCAMVNPEPDELGKTDVDRFGRTLEEFAKARLKSPLAPSAAVLYSGLQRLREQADSVKEEDKIAAGLVGKPAPDFALRDMAGREVKLSDYRGKTVLLVFWGVGCRLCKTEAPHLTDLYEKYKDAGLVVLAVECFDNNREDIAAYMRENKLRHPVLLSGSKVAGPKYSIGGLPRAFWIDTRGVITARASHLEDREKLESKIRELIPAARGK
jgi:peroxiredoxin